MTLTDFDIVARAARAHGVITRAELVGDGGLSGSAITRRVHSGALRPVCRGVYVVTAVETEHSVVAALTRGLARSAASHHSAASLHGMKIAALVPTVSVPKGGHHDVRDCRVVETRFLPECDRTEVAGVASTTAARTLCDLAADLGAKHLRQIVQEQTLAGRPSMSALIACHQALARRGRAGTVVMRSVLADLNDDEPYPASRLELLVAEGLAARGVVGLRRQYAPPWYDGVEGIVDFADPTGRTIIEADGRAWHTLDRHATRDRRRNRTALLHGWVVIRVGWAEVTERTDATLDELISIVQQRRASAGVQDRRRS